VSHSDLDWEVKAIGQMTLRWVEDSQIQEQLAGCKDIVDEIWQKKCAQKQNGLFNGALLNWVGLRKEKDGAQVTGHFTEYKYFLAAKERPELNLNIYPIAVSGISLFSDKGVRYAVFARRSKNVSSYPGYLEFVPSGSIDRKFAGQNGLVDFQAQLRTEFCEETGLPADCIKEMTPFACILDTYDRVYDICCRILIDARKEVIIDQLSCSAEYQSPVVVAEDELDEFVKLQRALMIPSSIALFDAYHQAKNNGKIF
jgi:hypothetical protein